MSEAEGFRQSTNCFAPVDVLGSQSINEFLLRTVCPDHDPKDIDEW